MSLEVASFIFGAILCAAALLGGGFKIGGKLDIPKIRRGTRLTCGLLGILFLGLAFWWSSRMNSIQVNPHLRGEQLAAINSFVNGTATIFNELETYRNEYPVSYERLRKSGVQPDEADRQLCEELYRRIRQSAKISESYSSMKSAFQDFIFEGDNWDGIREKNRRLFENFCKAIHAAQMNGRQPRRDEAVEKSYLQYMDYRRTIADASRAKVIK